METTSFPSVWNKILSSVEKVTTGFDLTWQIRRRSINTQLVVLFIFQIIEPHTSGGYSSVLQRMWQKFKGRFAGRPRQATPVTQSSMHEARQKVDESVFQLINDKLFEQAEKRFLTAELMWFGRRLFAVDGSKINLPPTLFSQGFNIITSRPENPQGLLSCCYNIQSKMPFDFSLDTHGNERESAAQHLKKLGNSDVVVYDRGYFSFPLLQKHWESGVEAIFRLGSSTFPEIQAFMMNLGGPSDLIIEINPSENAARSIRKRHPGIKIEPLKLRLIRYYIGENVFFLGTTVIAKEIPAEAFPDVYHGRWSVEEFYKIPKSFLEVENFHSKNIRGVKQELYASLVMVSIARILANDAEKSLNKPKKSIKKIIEAEKSLNKTEDPIPKITGAKKFLNKPKEHTPEITGVRKYLNKKKEPMPEFNDGEKSQNSLKETTLGLNGGKKSLSKAESLTQEGKKTGLKVMSQIDIQKSVIEKIQVNFKHALSVVFQNFTRILFPLDKSTIPAFLKRLLIKISAIKQKVRDGRSYVRRRKSPLLGFRNEGNYKKPALQLIIA